MHIRLTVFNFFYHIGLPLNVNSPMIFYNFTTAVVGVTWGHNNGSYDPSHYTVQLFANNTETESMAIPAENNSFVATFSVSFSGAMDIYARVTVMSKCNQTTDGVVTDTITITSKS